MRLSHFEGITSGGPGNRACRNVGWRDVKTYECLGCAAIHFTRRYHFQEIWTEIWLALANTLLALRGRSFIVSRENRYGDDPLLAAG